MIKTIVVLEYVVIAVGALLITTQILLPGFRGRPLFPLLRPKRRDVENRLAEFHEAEDIGRMEQVMKQQETPLAPAAEPTKTAPQKTTLRRRAKSV